MPQTIQVDTELSCSAELVWQYVQTSRLLDYVTAPIIRFKSHDPDGFPEIWKEGDYRASMWLFGFVPIGQQMIGIRFPESDEGEYVVRDNGRGSAMRMWDHYILIRPHGSSTLYSDRVTIDAGWRTPFVSIFAKLFYQHRQRRWHKLVRSDFAALK